MPHDREQEALDEIDRTRVDRATAWGLVLAFLAACVAPTVALTVAHPSFWPDLSRELPHFLQLASIDAFETRLRNLSPGGAWLRGHTQRALLTLGAGNSQVHVAPDGTLYFGPALRHLTAPPFLDPVAQARRERSTPSWKPSVQADPMRAVRHLRDDLAARGIELVVVPIPVKASVDGEALGLTPGTVNPSWARFHARLDLYGVGGVDALGTLLELPPPRFLDTDTHWRPEAMRAVAGAIASDLERRGVPRRRPLKTAASEPIEGRGDLFRLLDVPASDVAPDAVQVVRPRRNPDPESARVLLLGDSFANIYHDPTLGFGEGAGLQRALEIELGQAVRGIVTNAGGASTTRTILAQEPEQLENIDVVVWVFTARELSWGDWDVVRLPAVEAVMDPRFLQIEGAHPLAGTLAAVGSVADPRDAPYPDQIVSLVVRLDPPVGEAVEARVATWAFRDRQLSPQASLRPGDRVSGTVVPWKEAPEAARRASRAEVEAGAHAPLLWWTP